MPLMRIARGESVGILLEPLSVISSTTLKACASLKDRTGGYHLRLTCHLLLSCLLYQFEFPTLFLAMREIIVMRYQSRFLPELMAKVQIIFVNRHIIIKKMYKNGIWMAKKHGNWRILCIFAATKTNMTMIDNSNFLPQYALNQLADRVAMKVDYINRLYKADKVWDNTIELCQRIEKEPRDVSTVIIELKKDNGTAVSGTNIRWYHVRLTLIYILLYYRHNDIDAFKKNVFPQLVKNMGAYADDKILKTKIQQEIANIKEEDKLLEQASTKLHSIPTVPSASDISEGRKRFIQAINAGLVEINTINWADATIGFDRAVMKELFWGVEDDELLKAIVKDIINTWNRLVKEKDSRCLMNAPGTPTLSMAASIDLWKFGGLTRDTINKFFDDLWVERNARNVYSSVAIGTKNTTRKKPLQPDSAQQQNVNAVDLELIESLKVRVEELENQSGWVDCFDIFLHPSLNAQAIAEALKNISSPHLPKSERSYWWVFYVTLLEINWILDSANHNTILQWVNLHFNMGWDWRSEQLFKFTIDKKYKVKRSSEWENLGTIGKYYAELSKRMKETFVEILEGVLFDRRKFILPDCESPNGRMTKK